MQENHQKRGPKAAVSMSKSGSFGHQKRQFRWSKAAVLLRRLFDCNLRDSKKGIDMWVVLLDNFGLFEGLFLTVLEGWSVKKCKLNDNNLSSSCIHGDVRAPDSRWLWNDMLRVFRMGRNPRASIPELIKSPFGETIFGVFSKKIAIPFAY